MPSPEEAPAAADRIIARLQNYQPGGSIVRLLLEIFLEELRAHRLHMEERNQQQRPEKSAKPARPHPIYHKAQHHGPEPSNHRPEVPPAEDKYSMSGGAGPPGTPIPLDTSRHDRHDPVSDPRRGHRGRRSPPIGPHPMYKPSSGPLRGLGTYAMECIKYNKEKEAKKERRRERRARGTLEERREAKKKEKAAARAGHEQKAGSSRGSEYVYHKGKERSTRSPSPSRADGRTESSRGLESNRPLNPRRPNSSPCSSDEDDSSDEGESEAIHYESNPHSRDVDQRERAGADGEQNSGRVHQQSRKSSAEGAKKSHHQSATGDRSSWPRFDKLAKK
jgi:hypothetical protein